MTDYAAAPIQPIVQGLLTVDPVTLVPTFEGKGVASVTRTVAGTSILYTLTLDEGLPGNAGELQPGPTFALILQQPDARTLVTARGSITNAVPGATSVAGIGVAYGQIGEDGGFKAVLIVFTDATHTAVDPTGAVANGAEIIVWKGL
jgi:hypothetical protein